MLESLNGVKEIIKEIFQKVEGGVVNIIVIFKRDIVTFIVL